MKVNQKKNNQKTYVRNEKNRAKWTRRKRSGRCMQIIIKRKKKQIYVISKVNPERRRRSKSLEEDQ